MALPFQAFFNFPTTVGKRHHPISHSLDLRYNPKSERGHLTAEKGCFAFPPESRLRKVPPYEIPFLRGEGAPKPVFTAFDKQALVFWAFYKECPIVERSDEAYRIHRCKITYFLEDDTMMIYEPWTKNSQLWQGTIVKRHRFPKPSPQRDQYYTPEDLNIGLDLYVYGKIFHLVDCDAFTRDFLTKIGIKVGPPEEIPCDCYTDLRQKVEYNEPRRPLERIDKGAQFYKYSGRVLRFYGIWNDTPTLYGDKRYLVLHYYLEDDTIDLVEQYPNNCGRMPCSFFLRRCKVPKKLEHLPSVGDLEDRTILNVFGSSKQKFRVMTDPYKLGYKEQDCWCDNDLYVGAEIDVFGRKIFLYDCDEQTRIYYKTKYGIDNCPINVREPCEPQPPWVIPPNFSKFGDELDSLGNVKHIIPKPHSRQNKSQFLQFDKYGHEGYALKFFAKFFHIDDPVDRNRTFVISYFLSDDSIQIMEPPRNNSGSKGGLYLHRHKLRKSEEFDPYTGHIYYWTLPDFYVGAVIPIYGRLFKILDADEYAYTFLENYPQYFPKSNIKTVMDKMKVHLCGKGETIRKMFDEHDPECTDKTSYDSFRYVLRTQLPDELAVTDHEIITAARFYGEHKDPNLSLEELAAIACSKLHKANYLAKENCLNALQNKDVRKNCLLTPREVYFTLRSCKLPLETDLIKNIIARMPTSEKKFISYTDLLDMLDWEDKISLKHPDLIKYEYKLIRTEDPAIISVRYKDFLHDAGLLTTPIIDK